MKLNRSKALILLSVVAVATILGSIALTVYASGNGEESSGTCDLTDEQREAIRLRVQDFGFKDPWCQGPHVHKARLGWQFLNNSEPVELEGTAVAVFEDMLIINTGEGQIQIHLPQAWTVDGNLTMTEELFESGYLSVGENITVKALRADVIDKEGLCIYLLLGYEIIDDAGVHAYAVLPFNIET